MQTTCRVTAEGTAASDGQNEQGCWQLGLSTPRQAFAMEWARPILRDHSVLRGEYIEHGIQFEVSVVQVDIQFRVTGRISITIWGADKRTLGMASYRKDQRGAARKWIRERVTNSPKVASSEEKEAK